MPAESPQDKTGQKNNRIYDVGISTKRKRKRPCHRFSNQIIGFSNKTKGNNTSPFLYLKTQIKTITMKSKLLLIFLLVGISLSVNAQRKQKKVSDSTKTNNQVNKNPDSVKVAPKIFVLRLTEYEFNRLLDIIDDSKWPHDEIRKIQNYLLSQVLPPKTPPVQTTPVKPKTDSSNIK